MADVTQVPAPAPTSSLAAFLPSFPRAGLATQQAQANVAAAPNGINAAGRYIRGKFDAGVAGASDALHTLAAPGPLMQFRNGLFGGDSAASATPAPSVTPAPAVVTPTQAAPTPAPSLPTPQGAPPPGPVAAPPAASVAPTSRFATPSPDRSWRAVAGAPGVIKFTDAQGGANYSDTTGAAGGYTGTPSSANGSVGNSGDFTGAEAAAAEGHPYGMPDPNAAGAAIQQRIANLYDQGRSLLHSGSFADVLAGKTYLAQANAEARAQGEAMTGTAALQTASHQLPIAQLESGSRVRAAQIGAGGELGAAQIRGGAELGAAGITAGASRYGEDVRADTAQRLLELDRAKALPTLQREQYENSLEATDPESLRTVRQAELGQSKFGATAPYMPVAGQRIDIYNQQTGQVTNGPPQPAATAGGRPKMAPIKDSSAEYTPEEEQALRAGQAINHKGVMVRIDPRTGQVTQTNQ